MMATQHIFSMGLFFALANLFALQADFESVHASDVEHHDVIVYGATSGGVVAAIQLKTLGHDVLLLEPTGHIGGMTTGGLGATDIGNKKAIGGMAREFYQRIYRAYSDDRHWSLQKRSDYKGPHQQVGEDTQWTFEPHVAQDVMNAWISESRLILKTHLEIDPTSKSEVNAGRLVSVAFREAGNIADKEKSTQKSTRMSADYWIDASYEGDLLAYAGISYTLGRESNDRYRESLNGVQTAQAVKHQFFRNVSGRVDPRNATSPMLPGLQAGPDRPDGSADDRIQAYCIRMCLTHAESNRVPFAKPANYREADYELLLRNFESGLNELPWHSLMMPNFKTDTNNNTGFSTDFIGGNTRWCNATTEERSKIYEAHLEYQQGLMWTVANHPRVPSRIRDEANRWGTCKDEFVEHGGWSPQLYVREGRRLIGELVMTEHHCRGTERISDSVGMAAYTMDSHNVQRYVDSAGMVRNEGDVQVGGFPPYPISYQSLTPKKTECQNMLVPVCLSSSHIAFGSIRMEPVFMVLGQSAALAIDLAAKSKVAVQEIPYASLAEKLVAAGQRLE